MQTASSRIRVNFISHDNNGYTQSAHFRKLFVKMLYIKIQQLKVIILFMYDLMQ